MFRYAEPQQLDEIHSLILKEMQAGHFEPRLADPRRAQRIRKNLLSMIRRKKRTDEDLSAQLLVWTKNGKPAGWIVNTDIKPGAGNEFWLLLIRPKFRGAGEGGRMLDAALGALADKVDIYVRCYPASTTMVEMLQRRGFQKLDEEPDGNLVLKRLRNGSTEVVSKHQPQRLKAFVRIPA